MFTTLLIANRGEIACRIIRTAKRMGLTTIAVYADADRNAMHVQAADIAVHIGASQPQHSYLDYAKIIDVARRYGAQAIHPGYGFLSENAAFAKACDDVHITFVGPPVGAIEAMGSKSHAKTLMSAAGVPLLPGFHDDNASAEQLAKAAQEIGYPVLLKASAGGGGKGMRIVNTAGDFEQELAAARREAQSSFGDDTMLVEKYLTEPRHIELQIFSDTQGNTVHLFDRDCSIQRRHQKIIEEAPAPNIDDDVRHAMADAAIKAAAAIDYVGAGTIEFLLDSDGQFYFMEMNTRLQVEHPVTEMITGVDLVEWQLRVAAGERLPLMQDELRQLGHAVEARIYAEDTDNGFLPQTGPINTFVLPDEDATVRIDTGVRSGDAVSRFYDPMIAKLITHASTRKLANSRMLSALQQTHIDGTTTNLGFLQRVVATQRFDAGNVTTQFIDLEQQALTPATPPHAAVLAALALWSELATTTRPTDGWRMNLPNRVPFDISINADTYQTLITLNARTGQPESVHVNGNRHSVTADLRDHALTAVVDDASYRIAAFVHGTHGTLLYRTTRVHFTHVPPDTGDATQQAGSGDAKAPMTGTIVSVKAIDGQTVSAGAPIVIMEAMKMEHTLTAPFDGVVEQLNIKDGDRVDGGALLFTVTPNTDAAT